jgi:hypothetical protein
MGKEWQGWMMTGDAAFSLPCGRVLALFGASISRPLEPLAAVLGYPTHTARNGGCFDGFLMLPGIKSVMILVAALEAA